MRKLSFQALAAFALFCVFGTAALAQNGVGIGPKGPGNIPTATLHVFGNQKITKVDTGGIDILTWRRLDTPAGKQYEIGRIELPTNSPNGSTLIWNNVTNRWEIGPGGGVKLDTTFFELRSDGVWYFKNIPRGAPGTVIQWNGIRWEYGPGGGGTAYDAEFPIVIEDRPEPQRDLIRFASTRSDGNPLEPGDTWVWNGTGWEAGPGGGGGWLVGGNLNITADTDFFGTQNNQPIYVRTNNIERMRFLANGQIVGGNRFTPNARDRFSIFTSGNGEFAIAAYGNGLTGAAYPTEGGGIAGVGNVYGVYGSAEQTTGITYGMMGETYSTSDNAAGVYGGANGQTGGTYGVWGQTSSGTGAASGVVGIATETNTVAATFGVRGQSFSSADGSAGVQGVALTGATSGVMGANQSEDAFSSGVLGTSTGAGQSRSTYYGVFGLTRKGCEAIGIGVYGEGTSYGIVGRVSPGCPPAGGETLSYAVFAQGNIGASGVKQFHIDHPSDPSGKYLNHAAIESNQALNMYSGNITTDANGEATVKVPEYVQLVNKNFRYSLTCLGQLANAAVIKKLEGGQFVIKTDKPNVEVSWLITGERNDPYMVKNPFKAEIEKPTAEKGKYLHPELYNQPAEKGIFHNPKSEKLEKSLEVKPLKARTPVKELNKK